MLKIYYVIEAKKLPILKCKLTLNWKLHKLPHIKLSELSF